MVEKTQAKDLKAAVKTLERVDNDIRCVIRLENKAKRALHYIGDVRATRYDPTTKTLTLSLSDEGREVIPGAMSKLPEFRYIDPESEAEVELRIPKKIVKLSRSAPPGELAFETHMLAEAEKIVVEVAWADIPYYKDTRRKEKDKRLPAARWQQYEAKATKNLSKPESS